MTTKKFRKEEMQIREIFSYEDWSLSEFMAMIGTAVEAVPEKYRQSIDVKIKVDSFYDSTSAELSIVWSRPETDEEESIRIAKDKLYQEDIELRERRQLEELRQKYGR